MKRNRLFLLVLLLWSARFPVAAQQYCVVIDEIMADPGPQVGLPNYEWIELKNISSFPIELLGWKLADASTISGPMPQFVLQPDSFVVVCSSNAAAGLAIFGPTITVTNFPSLDNSGDQLSLKDAIGKTIHGLSYDISWYQNELKKEGGWTLEMIDPDNPCSGSSNWIASISSTGGTPGHENSVNNPNSDRLSPQLKRAYAIDELTIVLVFDEPVDSMKSADYQNYVVDGGLAIDSAACIAPVFDKVRLKLAGPMQTGIIYTVAANNITDCKNNSIGSLNKTRFGLSIEAGDSDIVINEILFNPRPGGFDYVEFYNSSNKIFDVSHLYIANRNSSGTISSITRLSTIPWLLFPGDYIVTTEDAASLAREYFVKNPDAIFIVPSLPSFPDDKGYVVLLNLQGHVIDEVDYFDDWHFKLIANDEGVALERIDPKSPSEHPGNWHSAGSTAGYGTPGYKNSQYRQPGPALAKIDVMPVMFSPDNDGIDDFATIQYKTDVPGYMANIIIFDAAGRAVRNLVRNEMLAIMGSWNWDGLDDKGRKLPVGNYIVFTELFRLDGQKSKFKNIVVLARRMN